MKFSILLFTTSIIFLALSSCKKNNTEIEILKCKDIDGNVYDTILICEKIWTTVNLKVSRYRNGDLIPQVQDNIEWQNLNTGAWCWYNNDSTNFSTYGKLYNWYAVNDSRGLVPSAWHVPTEDEWTELTNCLGGENVAGGKIKTRGTIQTSTGLWQTPNVTVDPYNNFNGLPGGHRDYPGFFIGQGSYNYWWSSTESTTGTARMRVIVNIISNLNKGSFGKNYGFYLRCIKD